VEEQGNKFFGRPCIFKQQKAEKKLGGASTVEGYCTVQFKLRHNWNLVIHGYPEEYKAIAHNQAVHCVQCLSSFLTHLTIVKNSPCLLVPFNSNVLKRMFIIKQITRKFVNISF
jgi:hypothetical protein